MNHEANLREANIRIKRWARLATEKGLVKHGAKPEVRHSFLWPLPQRWRAFEHLKWTLDGTADGPVIDTEACVAAAETWAELLHKYSLWAQDAGRHAYFHDRQLRGEAQRNPPPDPPEWAEYKRQALDAVDRANQNTAEWVKRSARAQMSWVGFDDPVKFELAWHKARSMGLVKAQ